MPLDKLILPPPLQLSTQAPEPTELASSPPLTEEAKPTPRAHPTTRRITTARPATTPWMTHGAAKTTVRPLATSPVVLATTQPAYVESGSAEGSGDQEMGTSGDQEASGAGSAGERALRGSGAQRPRGLTDLRSLRFSFMPCRGRGGGRKPGNPHAGHREGNVLQHPARVLLRRQDGRRRRRGEQLSG